MKQRFKQILVLISIITITFVILTVLPTEISKLNLTAKATENVTFTAIEGTNSFNDGENYDKLIDGNKDTKWCLYFSENAYIIFETSDYITVNGYTITTGNDTATYPGRNPVSWTLYGSNNKQNWTEISKIENDTILQAENKTDFQFDTSNNNEAYKYFKLKITEIGSDPSMSMQIAEFSLKFETCNHEWEETGKEEENKVCGYTIFTCNKCNATKKEFGEHTLDEEGRCKSCKEIVICETNFPDENFRKYLLNNLEKDGNGTFSDSELRKVKEFVLSNKNITDLTGLKYFTDLQILNCNNNQLTKLDVSKNTALTDLDCYGNQLTKLDVSNNTALVKLYCSYNQLTKLDVSNNTTLARLDCYGNQLTKLDVSKNTALTDLDCYGNQLTKLDVSNNTELTRLYCSGNQLTKLDVSNNTALTDLYCSDNQLTKLDVSKNTALAELYCSGNQLIEIKFASDTKPKGLNHDHAYKGSQCSICGEINEDIGIFFGYDTEALNSIGLNFYIDKSIFNNNTDNILNDTNIYVLFTFSNGDTKKVCPNTTVLDGKDYYVFPCDIVAKEMTNKVIARILSSDNEPSYNRLKDDMLNNLYFYTFKDYADNLIKDNNTDTKVCDLVKAMLTYGAYAQEYFNYNTGNLATNNRLSVESINDGTVGDFSRPNPQTEENMKYVEFTGSNLELLSKTTLRLFFKIKDVSVDDVTFSYNGSNLEKVKWGDYYYIEITDIPADKLDDMYTVTINDGTKSFDMEYSVMSYCFNVLHRETTLVRTETLKNLIKSLISYNQKANECFVN